jgi:prolyl 4-hydroxylase
VASVVGLPEECSESTQILRYTLGQEYRSHPDTFSADMTVTLARGGQRILTVIVWLTDVIAGGTTTFPNSVDPKVTVSPRKGDGLVFYNVMENFKDIDLTHIHSGDPLVNGTKVVAVMWFHPRRFV